MSTYRTLGDFDSSLDEILDFCEATNETIIITNEGTEEFAIMSIHS